MTLGKYLFCNQVNNHSFVSLYLLIFYLPIEVLINRTHYVPRA